MSENSQKPNKKTVVKPESPNKSQWFQNVIWQQFPDTSGMASSFRAICDHKCVDFPITVITPGFYTAGFTSTSRRSLCGPHAGLNFAQAVTLNEIQHEMTTSSNVNVRNTEILSDATKKEMHC